MTTRLFPRAQLRRPLTVTAVIGLHALIFLALNAPQRETRHDVSEPPSAITFIMLAPSSGPAPSGPPGSIQFTLPTPAPNAIQLPATLPSFALPSDFAALAPYVRCGLPPHEWREEREHCEALRAQIKGKDVPHRQNEKERIMMAQIDREMARRNAPTALPCIGISPSGLPCYSSSAWNDQHFNWK